MTSYCSNCIHYKVCGNEGVDDLAMTYCADKQEERQTAEFVTDCFGNIWCGICKDRADKHNNYCPHCGAIMKAK